jgi:hypothetical protein
MLLNVDTLANTCWFVLLIGPLAPELVNVCDYSYISMLGGWAMGDLHSLKTDGFLHPECPRAWRVWVGIQLLFFILVDFRFPYLGPLHVNKLVAKAISGTDP